ncbi:MAG: magnesium transporter [Myxococcales bacterium]|nr:magnesium transporter [Myxococcales bacterium]
MLSSRLQLLQESLQKLLRRGAHGHVERLLKRSRPVDVAVVMRFLDERQRRRVFDLLPDDAHRAETLTELDPHLVAELFESLAADHSVGWLARLVAEMGPDDRADLLSEVPDELRQQIIDALKPDEAEQVEDLLHYAPDTAGGIMSPDFFALPEQTLAKAAIEALQASADVEMAFYIYAVNEHGHLVGVVSLRALVTHPANTPLSEMMESDVISVTIDTDQEEVARLAARYNLLAIPVVDTGNHLVGIVTIDDVIDVIREEATEDILKMAGADESAFERHSLWRHFRTRAPWLFATWIGGLVGSLLIGVFQAQLEAKVALATFIPIVLGMGGNVGTQTATIIVRGLATGRVSGRLGFTYLARETSIGLMLGCLYGLLLAAYALVRYTGEAGVSHLALTVALSILTSMSVSATVGALTPLIFDRLNIDPAVATGPIVTTTVDVLGIMVYFAMASLFIGMGG